MGTRNAFRLFAAGLFLFAGCDSAAPDAATLDATAVASSQEESPERHANAILELRDDPDVGRVFVLEVQDRIAESRVIVLAGRGVPGERTYRIDDTEAEAAGYVMVGEGESPTAYLIDSGSFTITSLENEGLSGSFKFAASRFLDPRDVIELEGAIAASPGRATWAR